MYQQLLVLREGLYQTVDIACQSTGSAPVINNAGPVVSNDEANKLREENNKLKYRIGILLNTIEESEERGNLYFKLKDPKEYESLKENIQNIVNITDSEAKIKENDLDQRDLIIITQFDTSRLDDIKFATSHLKLEIFDEQEYQKYKQENLLKQSQIKTTEKEFGFVDVSLEQIQLKAKSPKVLETKKESQVQNSNDFQSEGGFVVQGDDEKEEEFLNKVKKLKRTLQNDTQLPPRKKYQPDNEDMFTIISKPTILKYIGILYFASIIVNDYLL